MFRCDNCGNVEDTSCWGSDLEEGFECMRCGYRRVSHFGLEYEDGPGLTWRFTPRESIPTVEAG